MIIRKRSVGDRRRFIIRQPCSSFRVGTECPSYGLLRVRYRMREHMEAAAASALEEQTAMLARVVGVFKLEEA